MCERESGTFALYFNVSRQSPFLAFRTFQRVPVVVGKRASSSKDSSILDQLFNQTELFFLVFPFSALTHTFFRAKASACFAVCDSKDFSRLSVLCERDREKRGEFSRFTCPVGSFKGVIQKCHLCEPASRMMDLKNPSLNRKVIVCVWVRDHDGVRSDLGQDFPPSRREFPPRSRS